jgi:hypothetical protein
MLPHAPFKELGVHIYFTSIFNTNNSDSVYCTMCQNKKKLTLLYMPQGDQEELVYLWLYSPCGPRLLFQCLNLYTFGRTPWMGGGGDEPVARPLPTHRTAQTQNKCTQTSMPGVGFKPTIPVFERAKMIHALDRAITVIGGVS